MKLNGIHIPHKKGTQDCETVVFPLPKKVTLPLAQHMGVPCDALVKVGDEVKVGQKIGDSQAFLSTPLHSSVSGKVTAIEDYLLPNGNVCKALTIETDGAQTPSDEIAPPEVFDKKSLITAVKESGCCGLGGAGFPTHIKLNFDETKTPIDTLVINAAECEPYITADYREIMESPDDVVEGIRLIKKYLGIKKAIIGIEDNKPLAIELCCEKTAGDSDISVKSLPSSYPQGAEKMIIFSTTGRIVCEGELPSNQGVMVINVSTVGFIYRYLKTGMPLISKRLTVDGDLVKKPMNLNVLTGTPIRELLEFTETDTEKMKKLIAGGPMMGMSLISVDTPVVKTNNAVLAFEKTVEKSEQTACIRCGSCMRACPLELMPMEFEKAFDAKDVSALMNYNILLCMNCGSCSYVCPAKRNLAEKNQMAKLLIPRKK